jgi:hypothetical protein
MTSRISTEVSLCSLRWRPGLTLIHSPVWLTEGTDAFDFWKERWGKRNEQSIYEVMESVVDEEADIAMDVDTDQLPSEQTSTRKYRIMKGHLFIATATKVLVRDEYDNVVRSIEADREDRAGAGTVVVGHPGIGTSSRVLAGPCDI